MEAGRTETLVGGALPKQSTDSGHSEQDWMPGAWGGFPGVNYSP